MTITRSQVEAELLQRVGALMAQVGMNAATSDGTNQDLNSPIRYALRVLGLSVASFGAIANADLTGVVAADEEQLIDLAEYRLLQNILGNLAQVDVALGPARTGNLRDSLMKQIESKRAQIQSDYGSFNSSSPLVSVRMIRDE